MKVEIWNGHLEVKADMPIDYDEAIALNNLFGWDIDCIEMDFDGGTINPADVVDANEIADFLNRHHLSGTRSTNLTKMITWYADNRSIRLSDAIDVYECGEVEPEVIEMFNLKYGK